MLSVWDTGRISSRTYMKPGWQHVKEAITTDQKNLTDDQRIHEEEKQELKSNERDEGLIPGQNKRAETKTRTARKDR
jgi:hypothetical protein